MEYVNEKLQKFNKEIRGKKIAIIGLGVSNIPIIKYLNESGANITVFDNRSEEEIDMSIIKKYNLKHFFRRGKFKKFKWI
ncbi:MAG: hypothetical protein Q4G05_06585 [Clostridia bacterium]|nr:hypothetical protein [Clostridia bacterium]